jgi:lipopolysaccharide transport system ATP-binding protein
MSNEVLVKVDNVSKKFCRSLKKSLWYGVRDIAGELFGRNSAKLNLRRDEFWAVNDVSFELKRGECLGLIGPNGAGKSTLLKMLNGIIKPDGGKIHMRGRVGALIELGAGFNPILTGRENIYVNAAVLGIPKKEVDKQLDDIIEFAEISEFIDTPVQSYSSGMKVRLGFAVAAHSRPDVLLIDEVLAVGDVGFRAKCFNAINEIAKKAAVILVSHSMPQVARVASDIMVMNLGQSIYYGKDVPAGVERYYDMFESEKMIVSGSNKAQLHDVKLYSNENDKCEKVPKIRYLDDLFVELTFSLDKEVKRCIVYLTFLDKELRSVAVFTSRSTGHKFVNNGEILYVTAHIPKITFAPGTYTLTVGFGEKGLVDDGWGEMLAIYHAVREFRVVGSAVISHAPILLDGEWEVNQHSEFSQI